MKKCLLITLLLTLITATDAEAQQRRRFFQNLFGSKEANSQDQRSNTQNQKSKTKESATKQTTTRDPYSNRNYKTPTLANPNQRSILSKPNSSSQNFQPKSSYAYKPKTKAKSVGSKNSGFGFSVAVNDDDQVYVSSVDRYGNAAKEGLRRGDYLVAIGGIAATSAEEYDEITKIMNNGDQMEFKIKRSGREKTIEIMYGELPEIEEAPVTKSNDSDARRYDFAPPSETAAGNSVLTNRRSNSTPVRQNFSDQSESRRIQALTQTIQNQNRQIQILQQQIQQLQRQRRSR